MTKTNNIVAKAAVAFVAVAMAFTLVAPSAKAQDVSSMSLEQLIALVNSLQGQLSGSTSGSCSFTFTRSLGTGSSGADVMNLQKFLNMSADTQVAAVGAAGGPGTETSFYGPATAAAVSKFQVKYSADILVPSGLTNPTGYFGPSSMAKANALCKSGTGTGTGTGSTGGALQGGAGDLDSADFVSSLNNEEVGEDQEDVEVMGLELEADGSDLRVTAVRVELEHDVANSESGSDDLDDYAEEVTIWFDGKQVGSVDVDDMDESNDVWSDTVSLDSDAVIREGDVGELVVAITALGNIDAADLSNNEWSVKFASVRYEDAQGAIVTETTLDDIDDYRTFEFASFASANDVELAINESDDNPDAGTVQVEDAGDEATLLIGEFEVEGSDITLNELRVTMDPSSTNSLEEIASEFLLMIDGDEVSTVDSDDATTASSTTDGEAAVYVFEDIDTVLEEGDTVEFSIVVVANEAGADFTEGASITASITANATSVEAEDESGEELENSDITGGITGNAIKLASSGLSVTMTDSDASQVLGLDTTSADDQGKYVVEFDVTAFEDTAFIELQAASSTDAAGGDYGVAFSIEDTSNATVAAGTNSAVLERVSGGSISGDYVRINAGQTAKFRLTVYYNPTTTGIYRVQMNEVGYAATAVAATAAEATTPAADFQSDSVQVQN